jgi:hypothetical protein
MPPAHRLQEKVGTGAWTTVPNTIGTTSKAYSGKTANTYYYKIDSWDGESQTWSTDEGPVSVLVTAPSTPTPTGPGTDGDGVYTISWGAVAGASSYELQEKLNSGSWTTIHNAAGTSKARSGLGNGTWYYRVRACSAVGCSSYSGTLTVIVAITPGVPPSVNVTPSSS